MYILFIIIFYNIFEIKTINSVNIYFLCGIILILFYGNSLFGDISINCDCCFYNFSKVNGNRYKYNFFCKIEYEQKTYIQVNFVDNLKDKYYYIIKCDNIIQEINKISIMSELVDYSNKIYEIKVIIPIIGSYFFHF